MKRCWILNKHMFFTEQSEKIIEMPKMNKGKVLIELSSRYSLHYITLYCFTLHYMTYVVSQLAHSFPFFSVQRKEKTDLVKSILAETEVSDLCKNLFIVMAENGALNKVQAS